METSRRLRRLVVSATSNLPVAPFVRWMDVPNTPKLFQRERRGES
jgi:hypothetical protein